MVWMVLRWSIRTLTKYQPMILHISVPFDSLACHCQNCHVNMDFYILYLSLHLLAWGISELLYCWTVLSHMQLKACKHRRSFHTGSAGKRRSFQTGSTGKTQHKRDIPMVSLLIHSDSHLYNSRPNLCMSKL